MEAMWAHIFWASTGDFRQTAAQRSLSFSCHWRKKLLPKMLTTNLKLHNPASNFLSTNRDNYIRRKDDARGHASLTDEHNV
jgi:hypothetical protein